MRSLRDNIGIVQQDVFMFADTILEKYQIRETGRLLCRGCEGGERSGNFTMILWRCRISLILTLESGERCCREGRSRGSLLARIFLKNPKILILDEATSALDTITESKIQESFDELTKGRTTLVIAHRLATVRNADRIVLIDEGKIQESGTHEELMRKGGKYAQLYRTQELK